MKEIMRPLAEVNFSFLAAQQNAKGWDNTFYALFSLFHEFEPKFSKPASSVNDRFILLTSKNIYVKKYQEQVLEIYQNEMTQDKNNQQTYLLVAYQKYECKLLLQLLDQIQLYLQAQHKKYVVQREKETSINIFSTAQPYMSLKFID